MAKTKKYIFGKTAGYGQIDLPNLFQVNPIDTERQ